MERQLKDMAVMSSNMTEEQAEGRVVGCLVVCSLCNMATPLDKGFSAREIICCNCNARLQLNCADKRDEPS